MDVITFSAIVAVILLFFVLVVIITLKEQARRHTSPALSSPSAGSDDYGSHDRRNHQFHDRIQNARSEFMEKENLARECFRDDLCNYIHFYPYEGHEREVSVSFSSRKSSSLTGFMILFNGSNALFQGLFHGSIIHCKPVYKSG